MLNEQHHITITLQAPDDLDQLLQFIGSAGFKICNINQSTLSVECYVDELVLSIVWKYLTPHLVFHNQITGAPGPNIIPVLWEHKLTG